MNQRGQQIEDAYNLVRNINFTKVVHTLEKVQTPELFRQYWGRDIAIPDKNEVHEARKEKKEGLEALVNTHTSWADQAAGLEDRLFIIARNILRQAESIAKLRAPDFDILNMQLIGQLWADADVLMKYYPVYKGGVKVKPDQVNGYHCNLSEKEIDRLCNSLIDQQFIQADAGSFRAAFSNKPLNDEFKPIVWKASQTLLLYVLCEKIKIGNDGQPWVKLNKLFDNKEPGTKFNPSSLKNQYQAIGKPNNSDKIDKIFIDIQRNV